VGLLTDGGSRGPRPSARTFPNASAAASCATRPTSSSSSTLRANRPNVSPALEHVSRLRARRSRRQQSAHASFTTTIGPMWQRTPFETVVGDPHPPSTANRSARPPATPTGVWRWFGAPYDEPCCTSPACREVVFHVRDITDRRSAEPSRWSTARCTTALHRPAQSPRPSFVDRLSQTFASGPARHGPAHRGPLHRPSTASSRSTTSLGHGRPVTNFLVEVGAPAEHRPPRGRPRFARTRGGRVSSSWLHDIADDPRPRSRSRAASSKVLRETFRDPRSRARRDGGASA